ncbi:Wzz/FepE/Etk N-terminal domain-containing protein [Cupriavidus sp. 30B13]|uniref:Wzz/FepE/Etk N-terminal domain-containing protein n=1 Tax=Cupriavidus sp. 30B13 TaxID=3384241 RepID=UPI003B8EB16E
MPFTPENSPENLSSKALQSFLAKSAKLLLVTTVIGTAAAIGYSFFQPPQWTAKMTVQIGQVTSPGASGGNTSKLIEAQLTASDRYNLPSFRLGVLKSMGLPTPDADHAESALLFDSLRASPAKSLDLINVQVSGYSREQAIRALDASFKALSAEHEKVYAPAIEHMKAELTDSSTKLAAAEQDYQRTYTTLKSNESRTTTQDLFTTNILAVVSARVLTLGQQKLQLEEGLADLRTYPTRVLGEYYAPQRPSTPGKLLYAVAGAAIGLMAGLLIALARNTRRS